MLPLSTTVALAMLRPPSWDPLHYLVLSENTLLLLECRALRKGLQFVTSESFSSSNQWLWSNKSALFSQIHQIDRLMVLFPVGRQGVSLWDQMTWETETIFCSFVSSQRSCLSTCTENKSRLDVYFIILSFPNFEGKLDSIEVHIIKHQVNCVLGLCFIIEKCKIIE